jgi:glucosamine-6-phosphate deaminase
LTPPRAADPFDPQSLREGARTIVDHPSSAELELAREIATLVSGGGRVVLGLATGSTPTGLYRELARMRREEALDFDRVVTFNLDEYVGLAPDHPQAFERWTRERVFDPLGIRVANRHVPRADGVDLAEVCDGYERAIRDAGGIDLLILGIGRNGHVGFNEPGASPETRTREVELHAWTLEDAAAAFGGLLKVPRRAITMGIATILAAKRLRVLAFGRHKAAIVRRALEGPIDIEVPASILRTHPDLRVWLDHEAASELGGGRASRSD